MHGSYARKEENENSDIDVLIIAKEKFDLGKEDKMDILIITPEKIQTAIELNPIMMYSLINEAVPIINESYLNILKENKINPKYFKPFLKDSFLSLNSDKEILNLDKQTGKFASSSLIYSLFLRLRGVFILKSLLSKKIYSNKLFKKWLLNNCSVNYAKVYNSYISIRDNEKVKEEVLLNDAESLLIFLENELNNLKIK